MNLLYFLLPLTVVLTALIIVSGFFYFYFDVIGPVLGRFINRSPYRVLKTRLGSRIFSASTITNREAEFLSRKIPYKEILKRLISSLILVLVSLWTTYLLILAFV